MHRIALPPLQNQKNMRERQRKKGEKHEVTFSVKYHAFLDKTIYLRFQCDRT